MFIERKYDKLHRMVCELFSKPDGGYYIERKVSHGAGFTVVSRYPFLAKNIEAAKKELENYPFYDITKEKSK